MKFETWRNLLLIAASVSLIGAMGCVLANYYTEEYPVLSARAFLDAVALVLFGSVAFIVVLAVGLRKGMLQEGVEPQTVPFVKAEEEEETISLTGFGKPLNPSLTVEQKEKIKKIAERVDRFLLLTTITKWSFIVSGLITLGVGMWIVLSLPSHDFQSLLIPTVFVELALFLEWLAVRLIFRRLFRQARELDKEIEEYIREHKHESEK